MQKPIRDYARLEKHPAVRIASLGKVPNTTKNSKDYGAYDQSGGRSARHNLVLFELNNLPRLRKFP
jgi:hypothetical protein